MEKEKISVKKAFRLDDEEFSDVIYTLDEKREDAIFDDSICFIKYIKKVRDSVKPFSMREVLFMGFMLGRQYQDLLIKKIAKGELENPKEIREVD